MTAPLTPIESDLRDFAFMPLDVIRLVDSDLTAIASGDEFKAAVILWCKAWHQVPAASLPDDDRMLAHLSGYGRDVKGWQKVRDVALRGFVKCDDGRLYHPVIAEKAIEALGAKAERAEIREGNQTRKQRERDDRSRLFAELRAAGIRPKWDVKTGELRDMVDNLSQEERVTGHKPDTPPVTPEVTQPVTPAVTAMTGTVDRDRDRDRDNDGFCSARASGAELERLLRQAAGWESEPHPNLAVTGPIEALLDAGADLELDMLPVVRAIASQARSRTSWKFFVTAIRQHTADRLAALKPINASEASHAPRRSKPEPKPIIEGVHEAFR